MRVASLVLTAWLGVSAYAQSGSAPAQASPQAAQPDPLAVGKAALRHEDFRSADDFFTQYVRDNPQDMNALLLLGDSKIGLRDFAAAETMFKQILQHNPKAWPARANLVLTYSESERWKDFDAERAAIAKERAAHSPNIPPRTSEVIDVFSIGDQRYIAREFTPPDGRFHTKYNVYWFGRDGKIAGWIACESDDVDQTFFAKDHPQEAAAGQRSYSLDGYTPRVQTADGRWTQTHSTIKFYKDGEPTYEQVRADVIAVVQKKVSAAVSSTVNGQASPSSSAPEKPAAAAPPK